MLTIYREPWTMNLTLSSVLRSNHDINLIPTLTMAFSAVFYMTNYAMKNDVSQYQLKMKLEYDHSNAALLTTSWLTYV
jgi:hypothetical protein